MPIEQEATLQVITTTQIISISGLSAIAGSAVTLVGIFLKSFLEKKENEKIRLFEIRKNVYSELIGHLYTSFDNYKINPDNYEPETLLKSLTKYTTRLNYEFAKPLLFSSTSVKTNLEKYKEKIYGLQSALVGDMFDGSLEDRFQKRLDESRNILKFAQELISLIREELGIK